jgi:hypothetical protein
MKRYGVLLGCVGVVALIGMAASCQLAAPTAEQRRLQVTEGPILFAYRSGHLELKTLRVTPELYVDVTDPPRFPCWVPDVRGFHPYPECEIVGMPFAGVKMCE